MSDRLVDPAAYDSASELKTGALARILRSVHPAEIRSILVVGCGEGYEAGILARAFDARTIGIDICVGFEFDRERSYPAELRVMDARNLDFADASFDFVYSFHALEHIPDPRQALDEMARVLRPNGAYLIGTPNKSRLVGYVSSTIPLRTKIYWNLADVSARLRGKWTNEAGAHAGFTESELIELCRDAFGGRPMSLSAEFYGSIYPRRLIDTIVRLHLKKYMFPCVYITGAKEEGARPMRPAS